MAPLIEPGQLGGSVLSQKIAAELLRELRQGRFSASERLPAEVELAAAMGVSRTVVRDALAELEREGYVERVRGIGTVVNRHVVGLTSRLDQKFEYNAMIRAMGCVPHADSVSVQRESADSHLANHLGLSSGQPVFCVRKRVLADKQPVIWSVDYLPAANFPENIESLDFSRPIFDIMAETCAVSINSTIGHVSAVLGDKSTREKLSLPEHEALLLLEETGFSKLTKPVIYSLTYYTNFFDFTLLRKKV